jgi:hypothetical protein
LACSGFLEDWNRLVVLDQRSILVIAALVFGMTATSGLLLMLEPGSMAPLSGVTLMSEEPAGQPQARLFDTTGARDWQMVVIHDSGATRGSSQSINQVHQRMGWDGLGYHFVINNGTDEMDGLIEVGYRWQRQLEGAYYDPASQTAGWYHQNASGICLIGDGDGGTFTDAQVSELVWLVQQLQRRFNIPAEAVRIEIGTHGNGAAFPRLAFERQLLSE